MLVGYMSRLGSRPRQCRLCDVLCFFFFCASRTVCIALGFYLFFDMSALPIEIKYLCSNCGMAGVPTMWWSASRYFPTLGGFCSILQRGLLNWPFKVLLFWKSLETCCGNENSSCGYEGFEKICVFCTSHIVLFAPVWVPSADLHW